MPIEEKEKFSWKRLLIVLALVVVTAGATFGLIWWKYSKIIKSQEEQINSLNNQISTLNAKINKIPK